MRAAIRVVDEKKIKDPQKIDPSLQLIVRLDKEGLLEAFILLALPDEVSRRTTSPTGRATSRTCGATLRITCLTGGAGPKK